MSVSVFKVDQPFCFHQKKKKLSLAFQSNDMMRKKSSMNLALDPVRKFLPGGARQSSALKHVSLKHCLLWKKRISAGCRRGIFKRSELTLGTKKSTREVSRWKDLTLDSSTALTRCPAVSEPAAEPPSWAAATGSAATHGLKSVLLRLESFFD